MRFTDVVLTMIFCVLLICTVQRGCVSLLKRNETANSFMRKATANRFISESFRKTCNGNGFESLNEWQITCRAMWKLDYIGWADARDFMEVSYAVSEKNLMYGKWNGSVADGEVYCRNNGSIR